ncbi:MAG TPA: hypothetical protein VFI84_01855 [Candidatus Saccharimonadales bacterium]|nr:hypothetical protein [Candidatus Saccharimonadales bacterium]
MEIGPSLPLPDFESLRTPEDNKESGKSKEKRSKKKRGFEALLPEKREQEAKKIADSLDKSPLFAERKRDEVEKQEADFAFLKKPESTDEVQAPLETIGEEERGEIISELAHDRKQQVVEELAAAEPGSQEAIAAADVIAELAKIEAEGEIEPEAELAEKTPEPIAEATLLEGEGEIPLQAEAEEETVPPAAPGSSSGSSNIPPPPRAPSGFGASAPGGGGAMPPFAVRTPAVSAPNLAPNPDMYTSADVAYYEQQAGVRGFLVGGIVGYLIGRRRGRIKTEKRLLPVQRKLEKEVKTIAAQLAQREMAVRKLSYEQPRAAQLAVERRPEAVPTASKLPESRLNLEKPARIERLGKAIVRAELPREAVPTKLRDIPSERVRTMNRRELLEMSEKVTVEGASLRQIYESHLIGEKGLRRLLGEYLAGKDIRKDLRREMVEREIDFERDPILRDKAYQEAGGGRAETTLRQMLEKVGASPVADDALANVTRLHAEAKEEARRKQAMRRRAADTAMVTVIVVLASLVAILLLNR